MLVASSDRSDHHHHSSAAINDYHRSAIKPTTYFPASAHTTIFPHHSNPSTTTNLRNPHHHDDLSSKEKAVRFVFASWLAFPLICNTEGKICLGCWSDFSKYWNSNFLQSKADASCRNRGDRKIRVYTFTKENNDALIIFEKRLNSFLVEENGLKEEQNKIFKQLLDANAPLLPAMVVSMGVVGITGKLNSIIRHLSIIAICSLAAVYIHFVVQLETKSSYLHLKNKVLGFRERYGIYYQSAQGFVHSFPNHPNIILEDDKSTEPTPEQLRADINNMPIRYRLDALVKTENMAPFFDKFSRRLKILQYIAMGIVVALGLAGVLQRLLLLLLLLLFSLRLESQGGGAEVKELKKEVTTTKIEVYRVGGT